MENKGKSWEEMTYEELQEYKDNMYKIWKRVQPEPKSEDWQNLEKIWNVSDENWYRANPEEAGRRVGKRQQSREPKTMVRPGKRTPWSVAVREVTKLNYEGMPYEELDEHQDKLTQAWEATFPEPTQEQRWMLEDAWGEVDDLWAKANPEEAAWRAERSEEVLKEMMEGPYPCDDEFIDLRYYNDPASTLVWAWENQQLDSVLWKDGMIAEGLYGFHRNPELTASSDGYLNPEDFDSPASMLMWAWENQQLHRVPEKQRPLESKKIVCPTRRTPWSVAVREVGKLNFEGMPYMGRQREGLNDIQFGLVKAFKETFPEPERNWGMLEKVLTNLAWRWVRANPDQCTRTPDLEVVNKVGFWMDEAMYVPHGDEIVYESDDIEE